MADKKLTALTTVTTPGDTDVFYTVQSSTDYKIALSSIRAWGAVAITGGTVTGITDLAVADGGTGASDAATARTNLGLGTISTQAASSVAITGGTVSGLTSLGVGATPINSLDVAGGTVIGATYAGAQSAPTSGLLVEGQTSFGTASPLSRNHVTINDTGAETSAAALYVSQSTANYNAVYALSFVHTDANTDGGAYNKYGVQGLIQNANGGAVASTGSLNGARFEAYSRSASGTVASIRGLYTLMGTSGLAAGTVTSVGCKFR